jgi:hypothetical protein
VTDDGNGTYSFDPAAAGIGHSYNNLYFLEMLSGLL